MTQITLECPACKSRLDVDRVASDPASAVLCQLTCPDCDEGDFHTPFFYDRDGRELDEESGRPYP